MVALAGGKRGPWSTYSRVGPQLWHLDGGGITVCLLILFMAFHSKVFPCCKK